MGNINKRELIKNLALQGKGRRIISRELNIPFTTVGYHLSKLGLQQDYINDKLSKDTISKRIEEKYPQFKYVGGYKNIESMVEVECLVCGYKFEHTAQDLRPSRDANIQCVHCNETKNNREYYINLITKKLKTLLKIKIREEQRLKDLTIECVECSKVFKGTSAGMKYCSNQCKSRYQGRIRDSKRRNRIITNGTIDKDLTLTKLIQRDNKVCHICGDKCNDKDYTRTKEGYFIVGDRYPSLDHLIPISKGGTHTWDNVKLAHHYCNTIKRDKEVYEEGTGQLKIVI